MKNPGRFKGRNEPDGLPLLGDPSDFLEGSAVECWHDIRRSMFWLSEPDRFLVEMASVLRGKLIDGDQVGPTEMRLLLTILGKLGGSPSDRSLLSLETPMPVSDASRFFT